MKKILVLHTGGTIAMKEDPQTGNVSPGALNPLLAAHINLPEEVELIVEDIFNLPSAHITPEYMLKLKKRIQLAPQQGIDSVVITHGTDTLEETAFFLDVTIGDLLPVILTGAMRSSNEVGSDGLYNLASALRVAACPAARGQGVLVVMNDEIHSARYVTKTHTTNVATFQTPALGPVGIINKNRILFLQKNLPFMHLDVASVDGFIPILKAYAGMDGSLLTALTQMKLAGLVVEALGSGNLPPETLVPLQKIIDQKIPVVLVSRCFNGSAEAIYDFNGGGKGLQDMGIIFCPHINSQKARLKLLIAQNSPLDPQERIKFMQN